MSSSLHKYSIFILACMLSIGIYGQEKVTGTPDFPEVTAKKADKYSKMPVQNPNYALDKQIKHSLIDDTPKVMPIFKPYLSLDFKSESKFSFADLKTVEEIKKRLKKGK